MSVSYFIRYDVNVRDVAEFVEFYRAKHVPVLARWPGLRRVVLHTPIDWSDTWPVNRGHAVLLAQLEFDNAEDLQAAFASPERAAARADAANFPPYEGVVTHQALESAEAWRRA
jgi:uncharacterized protein (TIGR02118 family)